MYYPKISIVTPNFNGSSFLEETIKSVINQNYPNLEYLVIDGGSIDGSIEIIKKYESYLSYWISEKDTGMYDAIQKGFDKCNGEIMAWINSDDMYHKKSLFTVAEIFNSFQEVSWIVGATTYFDEKGRTVSTSQSKRLTRLDFLNNNFKWIQQESVFWRRSLWEKIGCKLNTKLKYAGDFDLWMKFFSYEKLHVTNALVGGFRLRNAQQISIEHMEDYISEAEGVMLSITLPKSELKMLRRYKYLLHVIKFLKKIKFLRSELLIENFRNKNFNQGRNIVFDRLSMKFHLEK
jgi:glycosyltransferase involved in cell wall biosynthesis